MHERFFIVLSFPHSTSDVCHVFRLQNEPLCTIYVNSATRCAACSSLSLFGAAAFLIAILPIYLGIVSVTENIICTLFCSLVFQVFLLMRSCNIYAKIRIYSSRIESFPSDFIILLVTSLNCLGIIQSFRDWKVTMATVSCSSHCLHYIHSRIKFKH